MPFDGIIETINEQAKELNREYFQESINQMQAMLESCVGLPIARQKEIIHEIHKSQFSTSTSILSNIGLVKLPPSITNKVRNMEFSISQDGNPYNYSLISVGNILTMTVTSSVEGNELEMEIKARLENPVFKI